MASDNEYKKLFSQYQMALSDIQALKERQKRDISSWNSYKKKNEILYKNMEDLCQKILSKSKKEFKSGKLNGWHMEDLTELIKRSENIFEETINSLTSACGKIQRESEDRRKQYDQLALQKEALSKALEDCGLSHENVEEIADSPQAEALRKQIVESQPAFIQQGLASGGITIYDERKDHITDNAITDQLLDEAEDEADMARCNTELEIKDMTTPVVVEKPTTQRGSQIRREKNEKAAEIASASYTTIENAEGSLNEKDWLYVKLLAETGLSLQKDIADVLNKKYGISNSMAGNRMSHLSGMKVVVSEVAKVTGKTRFVKLSEFGRGLYCKHFNKNPADIKVSLWDKLVKQHDNLEHGYGIYLVTNQIRASEIFADVQMFDIKAIELSESKRGAKYKPDIICTDDNGEKLYIEYELGNHTHADFVAKCSKMLAVTNKLNYIVNNRQTVDSMTAKIKKWIMEYGQQRLKGVIIRMTVSGDIDENHDLRRDENWDFVWYPHKSIEPVVNIQSGRKEKGGNKDDQ